MMVPPPPVQVSAQAPCKPKKRDDIRNATFRTFVVSFAQVVPSGSFDCELVWFSLSLLLMLPVPPIGLMNATLRRSR